VSLSFRLAVVFSPLLTLGAIYLASRLGGISPIRFARWIGIVNLILFCVSLGLFVFDRPHIGNALALHAWALYGAQLWIKHHYKRNSANPATEAIRSLKL
jgi:hypothetical protein